MEHHAADQLDIEMAHAQSAPACFADQREALIEEVVERLAVTCPFAKPVDGLADLLVRVEL